MSAGAHRRWKLQGGEAVQCEGGSALGTDVLKRCGWMEMISTDNAKPCNANNAECKSRVAGSHTGSQTGGAQSIWPEYEPCVH